jgi:DNA polymerase
MSQGNPTQQFNGILDGVKDYLSLSKELGSRTVEADSEAVQKLGTPIPAGSSDAVRALREVAARVAACKLCPLHKTRTRTVPGQGNPRPEVMFVGEGPGYDEDQQGLAFVGRAGQLLTKIIEAMGFTRDEVWIGNIVKCRPPENRTPLASEVAACLPYLRRQIELVSPRTVVLLGLPAVKAFFGKRSPEGIGEVVGTFQDLPEWPEIRFFTLFHPAYLLRDPRKKVDTWRHLQLLKAHLAGV